MGYQLYPKHESYDDGSVRLSNLRKLAILLAALFSNFMLEGLCQSFSELYPSLVEEFRETGTSKIVLIGSLLPGIYLLVGPIFWLLLTTFNFCTVMMFGTFLSSSGFIASSFATDADQLILCYSLLAAVGFGAIHLSSMTALLQSFNSKRGTVIAVTLFASSSSAFVFTPCTRLLASLYGWRGANQIFGALLLNGIACSLIFNKLSFNKVQFKVKSTFQKLLREIKPNDPEHPPYIMRKMVEERTKERDNSTGSLDGYVITTDNCLLRGSQANCSQHYFTECEAPATPGGAVNVETTKHTTDMWQKQKIVSADSWKSCPSDEPNSWEFQAVELTENINYKVLSLSNDEVANEGVTCSKNNLCCTEATLVLRTASFILYNISFVVTFVASFFLVVNLPIHAFRGLNSRQSHLLVNVLWISNTVFRLPVGIVCDRLKVLKFIAYTSSLFCCGIISLFLPWTSSYELLTATTVALGIFMACLVTLKPIILLDMFGMERFAVSYSISSLLQGLSTLFAPLIARIIPRSHSISFIVAAVMILSGAFLSIPLKCFIDSEKVKRCNEIDSKRRLRKV